MPKIVGVHGVRHQHILPNSIHEEWWPPLAETVNEVSKGQCVIRKIDLAIAYYGDIFHDADAPDPAVGKLMEKWEDDFGNALGNEFVNVLGGKPDLEWSEGARAVRGVFTSMASAVLEYFVSDASIYFHNPTVRSIAVQWFADTLKPDTRIVIAHSMGSVVAYESLVETEHPLDLFVTLASPLGIRELFFDRLNPKPVDGLNVWPKGVKRWINFSQESDFITIAKVLTTLFQPGPEGQIIEENFIKGPERIIDAHWTASYLREERVAKAVADVLGPEF